MANKNQKVLSMALAALMAAGTISTAAPAVANAAAKKPAVKASYNYTQFDKYMKVAEVALKNYNQEVTRNNDYVQRYITTATMYANRLASAEKTTATTRLNAAKKALAAHVARNYNYAQGMSYLAKGQAIDLTVAGNADEAAKYLVTVNKYLAKLPAGNQRNTLELKAAEFDVAIQTAKGNVDVVKDAETKVAALEEAVKDLSTPEKVAAAKTAKTAADEAVAKVTDAAKKADFQKRIDAAQAKLDVLKVDKVSAVGAKTLKVTFSKAVEDTTKATFSVKKSGIALNVSNVTFAEDKMSATLELSAKLTKGDYVVSVSGLTGEAISGTATAEDEKVSAVEILSDSAVVDNTATPTQATVAYKVTNQYGEDITKTTSLKTNDDANITPANGVITIKLSVGSKVGDKVPVTLINLESAASTTKVLTLSSASSVSEVSMNGIYNKDGKTLNEDTDLSTDKFYLLVNVTDQYGNAITNPATAAAGLIKAQSNTTVVGTAGVGNAVTLTSLTINGKTQLGLELTGPVTPGENQITLISTTNGHSATAKAVVAEATRSDVVTLSQPTLAVANEDLYIPASVTDKNGNAITDTKILNNAAKGVKLTLGGTFVTKDNALYVMIPKAQVATDGIYSLVAQSSTYKVSTLTLTVKAAATPTLIRGLKSTVSPTMLASATKTIDATDLVIEDQYGRVMDSAVVKASLTAGKKIVVKDVNTTTNVVTSDGTAITSTTVDTLTAGAANGTEKFQFVLNDGAKDIASSTAEVTFRVTDGTEYKSYSVDSIGTVYDEVGAGKTDNDAYDKAIKVYGVLNDGSKVALTAGTDFTVTSTNAAVATDAADGKLDVAAALAYDPDATTVVVPITITINATGQQFTQNVTFSKVAPKVTAVKVIDDNDTDTAAIAKVAYDVATAGNFDIADLTTGSATGYNVVVTDQYGVSVLATTSTGAITFADTTTVLAPNVTITPVTGTIKITNNGLANAFVDKTSVTAGEEFNVTLTYAGGQTATVKVVAE